MAGSISLSMSQQFDEYGKPLAGGLLYTIEAGTTSTPQNAYQDSALTLPWPNPIILDAAGRIPQLFFADGSIKIRLTDSSGVQQLVADNVLVVGPSSGSGGGGGAVDATTVLATGDLKIKYGTGTLSGFVRANGRTIGSASSGATERANSDTQALFEYLWGADADLTVSGGRGASANADWTANKTIALPDMRGRVIAGMDTMGNSSADRLNPSITSGVLGSVGGAQTNTIAKANLPNFAPTFTGNTGTVTVTSTRSDFGFGSNYINVSGGGTSTITNFGSVTSTGSFTPTGSISSINGGVTQTAMSILPPVMVMTFYIKL